MGPLPRLELDSGWPILIMFYTRVGRSASEMVLQLLGGSHRLNPSNGHQLPTVVLLCGPHIQGTQAINCARHLSNHNVTVYLVLPNFIKMNKYMEEELKLFTFCDGNRISNLKGMCFCLFVH